MSLWVDEKSPHMAGFGAYYENEIADWLGSQEGRRTKAVITAVVVSAVTVPPVLYIWSEYVGFESDWGSFGMIILTLVCLGGAFGPYFALSDEVKSFLIDKIANFFGLEYEAEPENVNIDLYSALALVPKYSRAKFEDMFSGSHDGVAMALVECKLIHGTREGRDTVFDGILYTFVFNKLFNGRTVVLEDKGAVGNWRRDRKTSFERVRLEDQRFEKLFEVYGTDQVEARYLLTPAFLERIVKLSGLGMVTGVQFGFADNKLLIAMTKKGDWFEAGGMMTTKVDDGGRVSTMAEQIGFIFDVVDTLNLTLKTRV